VISVYSVAETILHASENRCKELEMLKASSVWEDAVYNLTREVKTLRVEVAEEERRFQPRTPAMAVEH
jgi:hypothetical protein